MADSLNLFLFQRKEAKNSRHQEQYQRGNRGKSDLNVFVVGVFKEHDEMTHKFVFLFSTDHSNSDEHPNTACAAGVPREPAPDRIRPEPSRPEGL